MENLYHNLYVVSGVSVVMNHKCSLELLPASILSRSAKKMRKSVIGVGISYREIEMKISKTFLVFILGSLDARVLSIV